MRFWIFCLLVATFSNGQRDRNGRNNRNDRNNLNDDEDGNGNGNDLRLDDNSDLGDVQNVSTLTLPNALTDISSPSIANSTLLSFTPTATLSASIVSTQAASTTTISSIFPISSQAQSISTQQSTVLQSTISQSVSSTLKDQTTTSVSLQGSNKPNFSLGAMKPYTFFDTGTIITLAISSFAFVILVIAGLFFWRRRRKNRKNAYRSSMYFTSGQVDEFMNARHIGTETRDTNSSISNLSEHERNPFNYSSSGSNHSSGGRRKGSVDAGFIQQNPFFINLPRTEVRKVPSFHGLGVGKDESVFECIYED